MTPVRTTCPYCTQVTHMAATEIFLALHEVNGATGDYSYTCPQCLRTGVHAADEPAITTLLAAGVVPMPADAPASRPARPAEHDDSGNSYRIQGIDMASSVAEPSVGRTTMAAIVQDRYGPSDVLRLADIAIPEIAADEVLVQVRAAGLSRGTWHLMTGRPYLMRLMGFGLRRPKDPVVGQDVAGVVAEVGCDVTRLRPGDEVFGIARGAFAQYAAAPADKLAHKPANLSFQQAAAVPISGSTALQGLRDAGRVEAGQKVLIIGASGGVGTHAVQLAKAFGAEVTGVCSTTKLDLVRSIGADHAIDYNQEDFAGGSQRYDVILDIGGNSRLSRLRRALERTGTLVIVGGEEGGNLTGGMGRSLRGVVLSLFVGQRLTMLVNKEHHSYLDALVTFIEAGQLTPAVDTTHPLAEAAAAMRRLETGQARGKIAITI